MNSDINTVIADWTRNNSENFPRFHIDSKSFVLAPNSCFWKEQPKVESANTKLNFFENPPLSLNFQSHIIRPKSITIEKTNNNLFIFGPNMENNTSFDYQSLDDIMYHSAPLGSVLPSAQVHAYKDSRIQFKPSDTLQTDITITFDTINMNCKSVEPLFVYLFLYDTKECEQISDMVRISCNNDERYISENESSEVHFKVSDSSNIFIVAALARWLQRDGGIPFDEYYLNPEKKSPEKLLDVSSKCCHKNIYSLIGYSYTKLTNAIRDGMFEFKKITSTTTCSDSFLTNIFKESNDKSDSSSVSFPISIKFNLKSKQIVSNDGPPFKEYRNEFYVKLGNSFFDLPAGVKGRNIYAEVTIENKGEIVETKTSLCQYHVKDPQFCDSFKFNLPGNLDETAKLVIRFYHAIVKDDVKGKRSECGVAELNLIENGVFIDNRVHCLGISYTSPTKHVEAREGNSINIETKLSSIVYTTSKLCTTLFKGKYKEVVLPSASELIPWLFPITDNILEHIKEGKRGAFKMLLKIIKLYTTSIETSPMLDYVRNFALRDHVSITHQILKEWKLFMDHSFSSKRSDILCSWFLFELLTKSIALDPENIYELEDMMDRLFGYLHLFQDASSQGLKFNKSLVIFERDLFDIIDKNVALKIISNHLLNLNTSHSYDRALFRDWFTYFMTPKMFVMFLIPIDGNSLLSTLIIPKMECISKDSSIFEGIFKHIFSILLTFEPEEQLLLNKGMMPLLHVIGSMKGLSKHQLIYTLTVGDFIAYNEEIDAFDQNISRFAKLILRCSTPEICDGNKCIEASRSSNFFFEESSEESSQFYRSGSIQLFERPQELHWDALAFCSQAICIKWMTRFSNIDVFNSIITRFFDTVIAVPLQKYYFQLTYKFFDEHFDIAFSTESKLKHFIRRIFEIPSTKSIELLTYIYNLEKERKGNNNIMNAIVTRALYKTKEWEESETIFVGTPFEEITSQLKLLRKNVKEAKTNMEKFTAIEKIASLIKQSPDSRVDELLILSDSLFKAKCFFEASICLLHCSAIISDHIKLKFDEEEFFKSVSGFSPSVVDEKCKFEQKISGYCTSKWFSSAGLIEILHRLFGTCFGDAVLKHKLSYAMVAFLRCEMIYEKIAKLFNSMSIDKLPKVNSLQKEFFIKKTGNDLIVFHIFNAGTIESVCSTINEMFGFVGEECATPENTVSLTLINPNEFYEDKQTSSFTINRTVYKTKSKLPSILPFSYVTETREVTMTKEDTLKEIIAQKTSEINNYIEKDDCLGLQKELKEIFASKDFLLKKDPSFDSLIAKSVSIHAEWVRDRIEYAEIHDDFDAAIIDI